MKFYFILFLPLIILAQTGCRNVEPVTDDNNSNDNTDSINISSDLETDSYMKDSESEINSTDTSIDTENGTEEDTTPLTGGVDEQCTIIPDIPPSVSCDNDNLIAQKCDINSIGCCCRKKCGPSLCIPQKDGTLIPCFTLLEGDLTEGFCGYEKDMETIKPSNCTDQCVPNSNIGNQSGSCYIGYEPSSYYCLVSCTVNKCDDTHMCAPMESVEGIIEGDGACIPNNEIN
ncbi:MAG: hypothetical protein JXR91_15745 [Deltaproteobacteria bacterium]|nr:hypothetical protein [Deltaproteobacteria bacterium]